MSSDQKIVVYVDMVADLFHLGHVEFLRRARALGDQLVVGICGDDFVTDYKRRPVMSLRERAAVVSACRYVDYVIEDCPCPVTDELLVEHAVSIVVHGDDYDEAAVNHWYGSAIRRGIYRSLPYTEGISTSDIIQRIVGRPW